MSNPIKELRKQLRTLVKEELPAILTNELQQEIAKSLRESMNNRMDEITKNLTDYLKNIEERQKDFQSYMIRQITPPAPASLPKKELDTTTPAQEE